MATSLNATLMVSDDVLDQAQVHIHQHPDRDVITAIRIGEFTMQAYHLSPERLAEILDSLAASVREQHALWLAQQGSGE